MPMYLLGYFLFPTAVLGSLLLLRFFLYNKAGGVNNNFTTHERSNALRRITCGLIVFTVAIFVLIYLVRFRIYYELGRHHSFVPHHFQFYIETVVFVILLLAELFVLVQLLGNIFYSWLSVSRYSTIHIPPLRGEVPAVAVLVPTCNEDPRILERSIRSMSRLDYPRLHPLIIENSRDDGSKEAAHQIANRYGVQILDVANQGTKAAALNAGETFLRADIRYLAIFDADQSVETRMISDLIPLFEHNHRLGWIQTAQLYEPDSSLLNCAISQTSMQSYDNLLEAFSVLGCAFCYGTNFIIRREALQQVGGWDEDRGTALTEDISTSFMLHQAGWESLYVRRGYATGIAPPTLEAFWKQQRRWATGTTYLFLKFLTYCLRGRLWHTKVSVIAVYAIALSYYTSVLALSVLVAWPTVLLLSYLFYPGLFVAATTVPPHGELSTAMWLFASLYPLYFLAAFFPYINMKLRGYRLRNLFLVQSLLVLSAPEYIKGVRDAYFNRLPDLFAITAKTTGANSGNNSLLRTPQLYAFFLFVIGGAIMSSLVASNPSNCLMWIILCWLYVNSVCLGHLFIFKYERRANAEA
jgi:cellulose synthase (UDP-forming)